MADTTTTRPKPRPRPKPVAKRSSNSGASGTPGAPSSSSTTALPITGKQRVIDDNDVDRLFIRNTNRSHETWQRLNERDRASEKEKKESSDSDNASTPRKGNKHKRKKPEAIHSQPWQDPKELTRLLSEDLSDSDLEIVGESSSPKGKPQGKRKRQQRSRSRSLTPPPAVPLEKIELARHHVRNALKAAPRAASPTFDPDESTDTIICQPELRAIAQEIKDQPERYGSQAPEPVADDNVAVKVKWHPHPLSQASPKPIWEFEMGRSDTFRDLFEAVSEEAEIRTNNLILTYQGNRIFPSVTPHNLEIWTDSFALEAYEKSAFEYIHTNAVANLRSVPEPSISRSTASAVIDIDSEDDSDTGNDYSRPATTMSPPPAPNTQTQTHESDAESEAEGEKFKITLRSTVGKDVTLTVRRTTKCGAILKAFLKKVGVADQYPEVFLDKAAVAPPPPPPTKKRGRKSKADIAATAAAAAALAAAAKRGPVKDPRLCIEGTKMSNDEVIGDEAEDGDMIDVVGL